MLQAQVNYWNLVETRRHNVVSEILGFQTLAETKRHNVETEQLGWANYQESVRHNTVSEAQGWTSLSIQAYNAESNRMNAETNRASVQETMRHNIVSETQNAQDVVSRRIQAQASATQAAAAMRNAATNEYAAINQASRWNFMNANDASRLQHQIQYDTRRNEIAQGELDVHQQNAKTELYKTQIQASRAKIQNKTDAWGTIAQFVPDVPFVLWKGGK